MKQQTAFIFLLTMLICGQIRTYATSENETHLISFHPGFFQVKDGFNYGLVFSGVNLATDYGFIKQENSRMISYQATLALGLSEGKGLALNGQFQPLDLYYGFTVNEEYHINLGAYIASNYQWQLYPELQSGHMFWFASHEIGPRIHARFKLGKRYLKFTISNSLAGAGSRPEPETEQYFYSLRFIDFLAYPHTNIKLGSFNLMNHTNMRVELPSLKNSGFSMAYEFDYRSFSAPGALQYLAHSIHMIWRPGFKK